MFTAFRRAGSIVAMLMLAATAQAADGAGAIATDGSGTLTMCRSWLLFHSCQDYNNIVLPTQIAVGDKLPLNFGSNPKDYEFPVARIVRDGVSCTVLSDAAGPSEHANKIEIASCRDAPGTH